MPNLPLDRPLLLTVFLDAFLIAILALNAPGSAQALPVFAHRYGFSCQQCHTTIPNLNAFGEHFRADGFRFPGGRPVIPIAVKVNVQYQSAATEGLPRTIVDEVELLSAGSLGPNASYFAEQYAVDGGFPGQPRDAWVQLFTNPSNPESTAFHARLGQFTLPLPVDPETQRPTLAHYAIFDQTVGDNPFNFFDPYMGADLYATNERIGVEAHVALVGAHNRGSGLPSAGTDAMFTVAKTVPYGTAWAYRYVGTRDLSPIQDDFLRQGFALNLQNNQVSLEGLVQTGFDSSANGIGAGVRSSGGYLQAGYWLSDRLLAVGRYDDTFDGLNGRQITPTLSFIYRPARNARLTVEESRSDGHPFLSLGLEFAY